MGICVLILGACSQREDPSIPRERFVAIYADLYTLNEQYPGRTDEFRALRDSVLRANSLDTTRLVAELKWYSEHPEEQKQLLKQAISILEKRSQGKSSDQDSSSSERTRP